MKTILFNNAPEKMHSFWKELIENPPEGYEYRMLDTKVSMGRLTKLKKYKIIRWLYQRIIQKFITPLEIENKFSKIPENIDFIFSPDKIVMKKFPWVCYVEQIYALAGNNMYLWERKKQEIRKILNSDYCKKIIVATEHGKKTFDKEFPELNDKIEVIHFASKIPKTKIKKKNKIINIIYVGSATHTDPWIFNIKGGREAIESFKILRKKYKNIKFKVVSNVPKNIDINIPGLEIVPLTDREKLFKLYAESDISLMPSYLGLGMGTIEALGSELPIICCDMFGLAEAIDKKNKNGFLINIKNRSKYEHYLPPTKFKEFSEYIYQNNHKKVVNNIVKQLEKLIENKKLREKMGKNSRKFYEKEFSMKIMKEKLKKIYDKISQ